MVRTFIAACAVFLFSVFMTVAQDGAALDYDAWSHTADRAELVIDAGRASDPAFETLREQLVSWRSIWQAATELNSARITTLRAQIEALGAAPTEGQSEPADIASQRATLTDRLATAEAPGRRAEAEALQAQGLIGEIDRLLAERQAGALLTLEPSPLNPANWTSAIEAVYDWARSLTTENMRLLSSSIYRAEFMQNLPVVVIYLILGLILLIRSWVWVGHLMRAPAAVEATSPSARLTLFLLSAVQHILPALGVIVLVAAIEASSFVGLRGAVILSAIPGMTIVFFMAVWIGRQEFPSRETAPHPLDLPANLRRRGRLSVAGLGLLLGISYLAQEIATAEAFSDADRLVALFPVIVLTGWMLVRIGRLLLIHVRNLSQEVALTSVRARIFGFLGRGTIFLGIAGPLLVGIGYFQAGATYLFPAALSLGLLAVLGVLRRVGADVYGLISQNRGAQEDALFPMLIGFVLTLLSVPVFALIWGARQAQLADYWRQFINGFDVGGVSISPRSFLALALVFGIGYSITRLLQSTMRNTVLPKTKLDIGGRTAVVTVIGYVGIFLAALIAITIAGIDLSSIALVAGALSVGIGFGLQNIVSNFISGIILLIERPVKEGDWIQVGTTAGYVREISVRSTRIETFDRSDVIVPNADLITGVVTNMTHHNTTGRVTVPVGVAYGSDTKEVESILMDIATTHPMVLLTPPPNVVFQGFGADSLDFEIRAILRDVNWVLVTKSDMNHEIAKRFAEAGLEIPFAQRDVWLRNPEALQQSAEPAAPSDAAPKTDNDGDDR